MRYRVFGATLLVLLLGMVTVAAQSVTLLPTDALSFDYSDQVYADYSVTGFEASWDGGAFSGITPPAFIDTGTQPGHTSYKLIPPFQSGNHTVSVRACNSFGCGQGSSPFPFGYAVNSPPTATPSNFRKVAR